MKRCISVILTLALLLALAPAGLAAESVAASGEGYTIVRDDRSVYSGGSLAFEHYYDKVVVSSAYPGAAAINADIQARCESFFANSEIYIPQDGQTYFSTCTAEVKQLGGGLLSIQMSSSWWAGGIFDANVFGYTYSLDTGEALEIWQVLGMDRDEALDHVAELTWEYTDENYGGAYVGKDSLREMLENGRYSFYVSEDTAYICYARTQLVPGFLGPVTVPCPINRDIRVFINDVEVEFDQPPVLDPAGRVLVPIRKIAEAMGDEVLWNDEHKAAFILHGERALIIKLLSDEITIVRNEQWKEWEHKALDVPAMVLNGRTLVPVRAFCESLGAQVKWDAGKRAVYITYDFSARGAPMTVRTFDNIGTVYYALQSGASGVTALYESAADHFREFYDQRDHTLDGVAMGLGDIWASVEDLFSGLTRAENIMKDCIERMLITIPDSGIVPVDMQLAYDVRETMSTGKYIFDEKNGITEEFLAMHPTLKGLGSAIYAAGAAADVLTFTDEQVTVFLNAYQENIKYLYALALVLEENGLLDDDLEESLERLEAEYANDYLHMAFNLRDKLSQFAFVEVIGVAAGGAMSAGAFAWKLVMGGTGVTEKGEALETFYGTFSISLPLDEAYASQRGKILSGSYTASDVERFRQLDDLSRAAKINAYASIRTITNDEPTKGICTEQIEALSGNCAIWELG